MGQQKFKANFWHFAALLRITQSLYNSYWPAKASRAFLISSGFSRSVITILFPGERDGEDMKGTKFGIAFQRGEWAAALQLSWCDTKAESKI